MAKRDQAIVHATLADVLMLRLPTARRRSAASLHFSQAPSPCPGVVRTRARPRRRGQGPGCLSSVSISRAARAATVCGTRRPHNPIRPLLGLDLARRPPLLRHKPRPVPIDLHSVPLSPPQPSARSFDTAHNSSNASLTVVRSLRITHVTSRRGRVRVRRRRRAIRHNARRAIGTRRHDDAVLRRGGGRVRVVGRVVGEAGGDGGWERVGVGGGVVVGVHLERAGWVLC